MASRFAILIIVGVFAVVFATCDRAQALPGALGYAANSAGSWLTIDGHQAWIWADGTTPAGKRVNSIYVRYNINSSEFYCAEVGWVWENTWLRPRVFWARQNQNGYYALKLTTPVVTLKDWMPYQLRRVPGTDDYEALAEGGVVKTITDCGFTSGNAVNGSERDPLHDGDTAYGSFLYNSWRNPGGAWHWWTWADGRTGIPGYAHYPQWPDSINSTNHWTYIDTYEH